MPPVAILANPYDGKSIRYVHHEQGYLLYCVGQNLVDDGGNEYRKRNEQEEKGDVAFVVRR